MRTGMLTLEEQQNYYDKYIKLHSFLVQDPYAKGEETPKTIQSSLLYNFAGLWRGNNNDVEGVQKSLAELEWIVKVLKCWQDERESGDEEFDEDLNELPAHNRAIEIFSEVECIQLREALQAIELYSRLSFVFISIEKDDALRKVVAPNLEERNPLYNVMARIVDWCLGNPVLVAWSGEEVAGPVAANYYKLITEELR